VIPNCCLVISVLFQGETYNLNIYPLYGDSGEVISYYFSTPYEDLYVSITYSDGVWYMQDVNNELVYFSLESNECPVGNQDVWQENPIDKPPFVTFEIFNTGCGESIEDPVVEIEINNTVYNPCKYKNALIKGKRGLSEDVAKLKGAEVFQLDSCKSDWSAAIAKYLAIDALKCPPYNVYTESDERCLISQLATNYKC
jgi:hypothetical protein